MAIKTKVSTPAPPSHYVDFYPACELKKEEGVETMIIQLQGFKKEQLRVQVNNNRELKVSGERQTSTNGAKKSRFVKEAKIPEGCDINDVRAKFINGRLHVTMPKKITKPSGLKANLQKPASASSKPQSKAKDTSTAKMGESTRYDQPQPKGEADHKFKHQVSSHKGCTVNKEVVLGFGIVAMTMVAIWNFCDL